MRIDELKKPKISRQSSLSLRHLHRLKKEQKKRDTWKREHDHLVKTMYGNPIIQQELIDLQKAYLELMQTKADITLAKTKIQETSQQTLSVMAQSGSTSAHKGENETSNMARNTTRRRKK